MTMYNIACPVGLFVFFPMFICVLYEKNDVPSMIVYLNKKESINIQIQILREVTE